MAEAVPYADRWPWLNAFSVSAGGVPHYLPGRSRSPLDLGAASLGVMICFESIFGDDARSYAGPRSDFLVTLTQDGWWGRTPGYRQHVAITRLRAIEARKAVVQVSVTGTTALILPDGTTPYETSWMERTAHTVRVPLLRATTAYGRLGDWVTGLALVAALGLAITTLAQRSPRHSNPNRSIRPADPHRAPAPEA
jgi:apolipoprotein N-acyltransferase